MCTEVALLAFMYAQSCVKFCQLFQNLTFRHTYFMVLFFKLLSLLLKESRLQMNKDMGFVYNEEKVLVFWQKKMFVHNLYCKKPVLIVY
jgi:hypothetical protein